MRPEALLLMFLVGCGARQVKATDPELAALQVVVPKAERLWSDYDDVRGDRIHGALDIKAERGVAVLVSEDGRVKGTGDHRTAGKWIDVVHEEGYVTRYLHLQRILVRKDDEVDAGEVIGRVGDSGNAKRAGPHLHFELVVDGKKKDPLPYLEELSTIKPRKR